MSKVKSLCLALLAGLILCGCKGPEPQDLPFETITSDLGGLGYMQEKPDLLVITGPEEVDTPGLEIQFPADLAEQLRAVDYQRNFVVIVFRGSMRSWYTHSDVNVLQVVRSGNKVVIKVHYKTSAQGERTTSPSFSSPYHIIAISKEETWARLIRFVLEANGEEVKERNHFVP